MASALSLVRLYFPNVTKVVDAEKDATIEVTDHDRFTSKKLDHKECALATACKRAFKLDGVIVSVGRCYLVKGNQAIRYVLPESVAREITSYDRGAQFYSGTYTLKHPNQDTKLGADHQRPRSGKANPKAKKPVKNVITQGIRHVLQ